jgi:hypothetical protein
LSLRDSQTDRDQASRRLDTALNDTDRLIGRAREVAGRLERNGQAIRNAAQAATVELEKADARARELREADRTRQQKQGSLEDDPETAPAEGTATRQADGGQPDPTTPTATLDQAPAERPGTVPQGWAGADLPPATTPTAAPAATATPTVEHTDADGPSDTGAAPTAAATHVVGNDTGSGGALDALLTDPDTGSTVDTLVDAGAGGSTGGAVVGGTVSV